MLYGFITLFTFYFLATPLFSFPLEVSQGKQRLQLTWDAVSNAHAYEIYRSYAFDQGSWIHKLDSKKYHIGTLATNGFEEMGVAGMVRYIVVAKDRNNKEIDRAEAQGYRKVRSDKELFLYFYKTITSSLNRFRSMGLLNSKGETIQGLKSGSATYRTYSIFKRPFVITIDYQAYQDVALAVSGLQSVNLMKLFTQSGNSVAELKVTGIYPALIEYHLDIGWGKANGGYYTVQREGSSQVTKLPWDVVNYPLDEEKMKERTKTVSFQY